VELIMADYTYVLGDVLDPTKMYGELEFSGVSFDKQFCQVGNFAGTASLTDKKTQASLAYLDPGKRAIYAYRNGDCIWGGILWSYQYSSSSTSFSLNASTWESWFDHVVLENIDFVTTQLFGGTSDAPTNSDVMVWLVSQLNSLCNIGISVQTPYTYRSAATTTNPIFPALAIPGYEYHLANEITSTLIDNDAQYYIDSATRTLFFDPEATNSTYREYDYPGGITNYVLSNTSSNAAVRFATLGAGSGSGVIRTVFDTDEGTDTTWPSWYKVLNNPSIGDVSALSAWAQAQATNYEFKNQSLPTFICNPDASNFDLFNSLGATVAVNIADIRTNYVRTAYTDRLIGWQLTPASSNNDEQLQFVLGKSIQVGQ
jgi:hypothetical protein